MNLLVTFPILLLLLRLAWLVPTLHIRMHTSTGGVASSIASSIPCATEIVHSAERETCRHEW